MNGSRVAFVFLSCLLAFPAAADQISLKNGDRITGEIVKKDEKTITVKSAFFGTVSVPWEQIQTLKSDAPVTVVLESGETLKATLAPTEGKVELTEQHRTVEPGQVSAIRNAAEESAFERMEHPRLYDLWIGTGTFGIAGTSGNAQTRTLNAAFAATRETRHDKTTLSFHAIKASSVVNQLKADTAQAVQGGIAYDREITKRFFLDAFNDYEYDKFQSLDLRATFGGGGGAHLWKKEGRGFFDVLAGGDYDRAQFAANRPTQAFTESSAEVFFGDDLAYKVRSSAAITQSFRMFNNLTETGRYRVNAEFGFNTRIMKWLNWNVALSDRYLSNPAPFRKTNDLIYSTGLGITFSLK